MDVIFLGQAVPYDISEQLSGISVAGNKMQMSIIKYMAPSVDNFISFTVYPVSSFGKDRRIFYKKSELKLYDNVYSMAISFLNIPIIKQIWQFFSLYIETKKVIKKYPKALLFTYNMYPQIGLPAKWIKKKYGNEIVSVLADLPIDDNFGRKGISKNIHKLFNKITEENIKCVDKAIVLNEYAWEKYAPQAKYIVIEGGLDMESLTDAPKADFIPKRKNILYSGSLNDYSGIKNLIDAMQYVQDDELVLDIYGDGYLREYVKSKCDKRIHYYGSVSNSEIINKQKEAFALINPRPVEDEIAKVTFPSKIFEYMNSGRPVISTRLNGFSDIYDELIYFAKNEKPVELARAINNVIKASEQELQEKASKAQAFVREKRNWNYLVDEIVEFMKMN